MEGLGYEISPSLAQALRLPVESGLLVAQIYQDSPADRAGLRSATEQVIFGNRRYLAGGDILITAVDGVELTRWDDLSAYLEEKTEVGQTVTLTIIRDGKEQT